MTSLLAFESIGKAFPGVRALSDVSFTVKAGRVHGLLGENGAGKSTLLKILGGEYSPDEGRVLIDGQPQVFRSSADSIGSGIAIIHQELQYVAELSVGENILLGRLPNRFGFVRQRAARDWVKRELARLGVDLDPDARLRHLSIGQRQMVEICKAILRNARIIALDEPTSSLSHSEVDTLFRLVKDLRAQGKGMIYISHRLDEIFELCDDCSILRDGRKVAQFDGMEGVTKDDLVSRMVGREIRDIWGYRPRAVGATRLEVRQLQGPGLAAPASFKVGAGEIVGFFGLVGAGRSELMRLIYGAQRRRGGQLLIDGEVLKSHDIPAAIRAGIALCPEDRKEEGIIACRSVAENINISCRRQYRRLGLFTNDAREAANARQYIDRLHIRTPSSRQEIRLLSGGNQQKAVLARWLAEQNMRVLIIDEPTRGIDVGAKNEIYSVLYELAERGMAIVMVSSELPEVMGVADRVLIMRQGRIVGELSRGEASEARILELALPVDSRNAAA
jgi:L-arabinose transport system ATP-binding protein